MAKSSATARDREQAAAAARQGARIQAKIDKKPPPKSRIRLESGRSIR
jgi:hypothetical protein